MNGWIRRGGGIALVVGLGLTAACSNKPNDDPKDYVAKVTAGRAAKDEDFQRSPEPIPASRKAELLPLAYFPVDPEYHVAAALRAEATPSRQLMPTSTGQQRQMLKVGTLEFSLKGQQLSLVAFTETDLNHLTVMFTDKTTGTESYPAGRYIDLARTGTGLYELDFNLAYSPYCYYNITYECPIAPPENRLPIPIHAGEKMKKTE